MNISYDQVEGVAKLARLSMTPAELQQCSEQLSGILTYVEKLNELDTKNTEPTSHVLPLSNVFREDHLAPSLSADAVLGNAPEREGRFFRVPKIIE